MEINDWFRVSQHKSSDIRFQNFALILCFCSLEKEEEKEQEQNNLRDLILDNSESFWSSDNNSGWLNTPYKI